jgi:hypothetical protein
MDDELIRVCALATRVACQRMSPAHLRALRDSVEQHLKGLLWMQCLARSSVQGEVAV